MEFFFESLKHILDPDWIMNNGGLYLVLLILFIETGIFIGFFLPGDPLLFVAGMVIASANDTPYPFDTDVMNLIFWMVLFSSATMLGYFVGYKFGEKFGHVLERKKDSLLFKKRYIDTAKEFYEKRGGFTVGISRFLPVVRTFAPIVAGMVKMGFRKFSFYNVLGALIWVVSITSLGYILGEHPWIQKNLEFVILGIVLLVTMPVILKIAFKRKAAIA